MPVLRKLKSGASELVEIDLNDVLFIKIEDRNIVYHTLNEKFSHISTLSDLEDHLFDFGFDMLDKTNIVNMNRIKYLNEKHGNIYFEEQPTRESKFASIALIKQKVLKDRLHQCIAANTGKTYLEASKVSKHKEELINGLANPLQSNTSYT